MSKAGPLKTSVSKRIRRADSAADNSSHANVVQAPLNAQSPHPLGWLGSRPHSDEIVIGLALGSPRQSPLPGRPPDDRDVHVSYVCSSPENPSSTVGNVCEIGSGGKDSKRKVGRWKSLGSLFGRREVRSTSPFYQLDQRQRPEPAKQTLTQDYLKTNALRRKRADSTHGNKAHQVDSPTGVPREESNGLLRRNSSRRRGLRRKVEDPPPEMQSLPAKFTANAKTENLDFQGEQQGSQMPGPSLLHVEIPCVELERYSVMFGDVLEPQVQQTKSQPSLLARRQVHMEEVRTVTDSNNMPFDFDLPKSGMRADSVQSKSPKSPSFSLFPSTPPISARGPVNKLLPKPSPLSRSVTAPSNDPFPPRPAIKKSETMDQDHVLVIAHNSQDIPGTRMPHGCQTSFDPSQRSANSTTASFLESAEYPGYSHLTFEPDPPAPTKGATHDSLQHAFPERKSSMKQLGSPEPRHRQQREESIGSAPEVSVARQISISRRQRQLLVPIIPKTARQPMQPRINEQLATEKSRKSHRLILEDP